MRPLRSLSTLALAPLRFAAMTGSSLATPAAATWVTDFLNAAYFAWPPAVREVADLRLASGIITTRWAGLGGRRLGGRDVIALNRAFGLRRLTTRGRLDHRDLHEGARELIGDWFTAAWSDPRRRGHGIAFASESDREAFVPELRLAHAPLGPLTPPQLPVARRQWATHDRVALPDAEAALRLLQTPSAWPDFASDSGRFTALRRGGLLGQTFEIEVVAHPAPRIAVSTRGYVTCTTFVAPDDDRLGATVNALIQSYEASPGSGPPLLAAGAEPIALVILTTHEGHFLGRALSHLLIWRDAQGAWIRDIGAWDRLPIHLNLAYQLAGRAAQHAFWGPLPPAHSMLAQLAQISAHDQRGRPPARQNNSLASMAARMPDHSGRNRGDPASEDQLRDRRPWDGISR